MVADTILTNIAVPVIVGGIAGMTLSMTGVDKVHEISSHAFQEATKLEKENFTAITSYNYVLYATFILIFMFFITEVVVLLGIYFEVQTLVFIGYVALIASLAFMLFFYFIIMRSIPQPGLPDNVESFKNVKVYPNP